jgi:hypothetical protein
MRLSSLPTIVALIAVTLSGCGAEGRATSADAPSEGAGSTSTDVAAESPTETPGRDLALEACREFTRSNDSSGATLEDMKANARLHENRALDLARAAVRQDTAWTILSSDLRLTIDTDASWRKHIERFGSGNQKSLDLLTQTLNAQKAVERECRKL